MRRAGQRPVELLGLTQHCTGSCALSQIYIRCSTSIPLVKECLVGHGSVDSDKKLVGLAGLALCHKYLRRFVLLNFKHSLTPSVITTVTRFRTSKVNTLLTPTGKYDYFVPPLQLNKAMASAFFTDEDLGAHQVTQCIGIAPVTAQNRLLPPRIARCLRAHPSGVATLVAKQPAYEQPGVQCCALLREQRAHPALHLPQRRCPQLKRCLNRCDFHCAGKGAPLILSIGCTHRPNSRSRMKAYAVMAK